MDSGRYFSLVWLDSCLNRTPDLAVMSSKAWGGLGEISFPPQSLLAGAMARQPNRNDRRFIASVALRGLEAESRE